ncbi:MAG: RecX family transcriptional regulator [Ardenticatenia bacterium]|nr:RecX family transcriptional regulator [Ardenticatenia bacterium]
MPTITRLLQQPGRSCMVSVFLDNEFALAVDLDLAANLFVGQQLTDDLVRNLREDNAYQQALARSLRFLGYRARSELELTQRLKEWDVDPGIAARVLSRLRQLRLVDDQAFAAWWVESRGRQSPRGRLAMHAELRGKGVADTVIEEALAEIDEDATVLRLALARAAQLRRLPRPDFDRRLGGFLARRGFSGATIRRALAQAWAAQGMADLPED